jgi:hypothetical protein
MRKRNLATFAVIALVLGACAEGPSGSLADSSSQSSDAAAKVLERLGSSRVEVLRASDNVVYIQGSASNGEADLTRTLWYESIAATAYAQLVPVNVASRTVMGEAGKVLAVEEDPVAEGSQDAFAPTSDTAAEIAAVIEAGAKSLGVDVVSVEYVGLFGGIAEIVVEPGDVKRFISEAGSNVPILLDRLAKAQRPYLVIVVDADQNPQFVVGYAPGLGGDGQGLAWVTPGMETDAIWAMPVPSDQIGGEDG